LLYPYLNLENLRSTHIPILS
ncbi:hypothetical protein CISIN_1g0065081mg, partial [Citrus sinensis]